MREEEPGTKWFTTQLTLHDPRYRQPLTDLREENKILDLISAGAPLPVVLNNLCTAIDLQIGNVVSVILLPDDAERDSQTTARGAQEFGLHIFWTENIPLRDENVLGSFEMYCCVPRLPSAFETQLIQRAAELAGLAIRNHHSARELDEDGSERKKMVQKTYEAALLN